jgi:outer membrane protein OmpA-like peptidoglycan-associated protein
MMIQRFFWTIALMVLSLVSQAQVQDPQEESNYVVIGAFAKLDNAVNFTNAANQDNFQAQYAIHTQRKLYYVFILNATDRKKAFSFLLKIRVETKYKDAWVYIGKLGEETNAVVEPKPVLVGEERPVEPIVATPVVEEKPKKDSVISQAVITVDSSAFNKPVEEPEKKPDGKPFLFKLLNSESGNEVRGEVHVAEAKATQYQAINGNELIYLMPPKNSSGIYQVSIQAPGYKLAKLAFNYNDPSAVSSGIGEKQESIITIELVRAKKGDYIDFNNVRFFRNSAILEPTSQNELDGLVALMKENLKYKIKIHGHCNGEEPRDIITVGTSTTIFALDPSQNGKENASAKRLTELRAEVVKGYLVSQGIEEGRVSITGEGGKMMIYPKTSTLANYNDRIEIEILKGK